MDRLSAVGHTRRVGFVLAALGALGSVVACDGKSDKSSGDPPSRTNGAKVAAHQAATTDAFCDLHATDAAGQAFQWPELAAGSVAPAATRGWRWVNVWATWCKPCIEEMPRIKKWRDKLAAAGTPVELSFLSVDEAEDDVTAFRKLHPEAPETARFATKEQGTAWLKALGLDGAAIPIHVFVSPAGKVRCARAGGVREQDFDVVGKLLTE